MILPYTEDRQEVHDPYFRVEVRGKPLPEHLRVLEATFTEEEGKRATATLRVLDKTATFFENPFVKKRDTVKMWFGYFLEHQERGPFRVQKVTSVYVGPDIEVEIELGERGDGFRGQVRCRVFTNGTLGDVLERVATQAGLRWRPERLSEYVLATEVTSDRAWVQNNESDGAFMRRIAEAHGLRLTIADGQVGAAPPSARQNLPPMLLKYGVEDGSMKTPRIESESRRPPSTRRDRSEEEEAPQICLDESFQLGEDFAGFGPSDFDFGESAMIDALMSGLGDLPYVGSALESTRSLLSGAVESEIGQSVIGRIDSVIDSAMSAIPNFPGLEIDSAAYQVPVVSEIPVVDLGGRFMSGGVTEVPISESGRAFQGPTSPAPEFVQGRMSVPGDAEVEQRVRVNMLGEVETFTVRTPRAGNQELETEEWERASNWDEIEREIRGTSRDRSTPGRAEGAGGDGSRLAGIRASRGSTSYSLSFDMPFGCIRIRPRMAVVVDGLSPILSGAGYRVTRVALRFDSAGGFDTSCDIERTLPFIVDGEEANDRRRRRGDENGGADPSPDDDTGLVRGEITDDGDDGRIRSSEASERVRMDRVGDTMRFPAP